MKNAAFTVCNIAYLDKALALSKSFSTHNNFKLHIYIVDGKRSLPDFVHEIADIVWVEDLNVSNLKNLAFRYDVTELSTSIKPLIALKLLESFDKVIFLDPDTYVYHSLSDIYIKLNVSPVILTPHYITPHAGGDLGMLRFGSFNLGFFAVNASDNSCNFLNWWAERCIDYCYFETQFGLSTDQKWVSIAPCFFPWIEISHDMSLNMAFWNLHERLISKIGSDFFVNNTRLKFFHFSSFDFDNPRNLTKRPIPFPNQVNDVLIELAINYDSVIRELSKKTYFIDKTYKFDYLSDGSYITETLRRAYASRINDLKNIADPFIFSGEIKKFIINNNLHSKKRPTSHLGFSDVRNYEFRFKFINFIMRLILKLIGPSSYSNFSRLLVFLSSCRLNKNMWKI